MIKFLHDWLTIIIAALSLIMSIITNKKNSKQNCEYREKMQEVEFEKEKIHQRERKIDEMFMQLNSRSNLIPYFHLILDDSKIEKIIHNGSRQIKLVIGLINIRKRISNKYNAISYGRRIRELP